jgi:hypothetical protein
MVIDTAGAVSAHVVLPTSLEGRVGSLRLVAWYIANGAVGPYFQLKFGYALKTLCQGFGTGILADAIQVPWPPTVAAGAINPVLTAMPKGIRVSGHSRIPGVFDMYIFDAAGAPLAPTRLVLWFEVDVKD